VLQFQLDISAELASILGIIFSLQYEYFGFMALTFAGVAIFGILLPVHIRALLFFPSSVRTLTADQQRVTSFCECRLHLNLEILIYERNVN